MADSKLQAILDGTTGDKAARVAQLAEYLGQRAPLVEQAREHLRAAVLALVDSGESKSAAARLAGVARETVHKWLRDREQASA